MRYRGAAGGAEKAHSRQRRWCLWSKPVNLGAWGLVPDPIAMAHAFAELGYGTVEWYTLAKAVSNVGTFPHSAQTPFYIRLNTHPKQYIKDRSES